MEQNFSWEHNQNMWVSVSVMGYCLYKYYIERKVKYWGGGGEDLHIKKYIGFQCMWKEKLGMTRKHIPHNINWSSLYNFVWLSLGTQIKLIYTVWASFCSTVKSYLFISVTHMLLRDKRSASCKWGRLFMQICKKWYISCLEQIQ